MRKDKTPDGSEQDDGADVCMFDLHIYFHPSKFRTTNHSSVRVDAAHLRERDELRGGDHSGLVRTKQRYISILCTG